MISTTNLNCNAKIPGMSQSLLQNRDDNVDELDSFFNNNNEVIISPIFVQTVSPYNRLKASFKALTALMEGNCDEKKLKVIEQFSSTINKDISRRRCAKMLIK